MHGQISALNDLSFFRAILGTPANSPLYSDFYFENDSFWKYHILHSVDSVASQCNKNFVMKLILLHSREICGRNAHLIR